MNAFDSSLVSFYESLRPARLMTYEDVFGAGLGLPATTTWEAVLGSWADVDLKGAERAMEPWKPSTGLNDLGTRGAGDTATSDAGSKPKT
ncbi:hypothetical protein [Rhodobacter sp. NSM]|uniref:hypothetical protein n=1 Tax=Rhodobacter sp. NSM TaxID=3457501 RepID=UPI003FD5E12A